MRLLGKIGRPAGIVTFAACVILILCWVPKEQVASLRGVKGIDPKDVFKAENDAHSTLAQIIGGFAVLVGLYFAWKNIAETAKSLELTNKNLDLAKEGQITDRFTKAIDQLESPQLELRLGGIYGLKRIAQDSVKDYWPIMEILTAYVREHARDESSDAKPLAKDIQAILTVVGRRAGMFGAGEDQQLDLRNVNLGGAELIKAYLRGAKLEGANLSRALLGGAKGGANLEFAKLSGADLTGAKLAGAWLEGANLESAILLHANLNGVDLRKAINLTQQQVSFAYGDQDTKLPPGYALASR